MTVSVDEAVSVVDVTLSVSDEAVVVSVLVVKPSVPEVDVLSGGKVLGVAEVVSVPEVTVTVESSTDVVLFGRTVTVIVLES